MTNEKEQIGTTELRALRIRVAAFLLIGVAVLAAFGAAYQILNTIQTLDRVERQRDTWQRPAEVIRELQLSEHSAVVDLGSGSGYFSLKLSHEVPKGKVFAVDVRRPSLFFLSIRALLRGQRNIATVRGRAEDPYFGDGTINAVLISNTYHEFSDPKKVLAQVRRFLAPDGRLVVLDRADEVRSTEERAESNGHHHATEDSVETSLTRSGFEILSKDMAFIRIPGQEVWWLIVARKPATPGAIAEGSSWALPQVKAGRWQAGRAVPEVTPQHTLTTRSLTANTSAVFSNDAKAGDPHK
jgi:SAM-dependent methyltransferase